MSHDSCYCGKLAAAETRLRSYDVHQIASSAASFAEALRGVMPRGGGTSGAPKDPRAQAALADSISAGLRAAQQTMGSHAEAHLPHEHEGPCGDCAGAYPHQHGAPPYPHAHPEGFMAPGYPPGAPPVFVPTGPGQPGAAPGTLPHAGPVGPGAPGTVSVGAGAIQAVAQATVALRQAVDLLDNALSATLGMPAGSVQSDAAPPPAAPGPTGPRVTNAPDAAPGPA